MIATIPLEGRKVLAVLVRQPSRRLAPHLRGSQLGNIAIGGCIVMDITISLGDEHLPAIDAAFDLADATAAQKREAYKKFSLLATTLLSKWIAGSARYRSLTEMNIETVQALYEQLLTEEAPSADRLFNKFKLPPGQAAYIARFLMEKEVPR